ncbi:MAG: hypothetical protein Kow002_19920 [Anaerolineales bacterium]
MSFEYDNKGKIYTEVIPKTAIPALVQTTTHLIKGNVHVRRDERLKDELDRDELFLAVTDVAIIDPAGEIFQKVPFLAVRRAQIVWVAPDEEAEPSGSET